MWRIAGLRKERGQKVSDEGRRVTARKKSVQKLLH
jgi:hypothetical protein